MQLHERHSSLRSADASTNSGAVDFVKLAYFDVKQQAEPFEPAH